MLAALAALEADKLVCRPQPTEGITYAAKIDKTEAHIDWRRPATHVCDHIRGLSPFPGAWFELGPERLKVLRAEVSRGHGEPGRVLDDSLVVGCGEGAVRLLELQRAGRKPMPALELLRGHLVPVGTQLG